MPNRVLQYLLDLARIERYSVLRRWHHLGRERAFLSFDRDSVARAVAIGFFFGILTPVAQILFSLVVAVAVRANLVVAAGSTLITNPFVMPFVYYFAYRIGLFLLEGGGTPSAADQAEVLADAAESEEAASMALEVTGWFDTLIDWATSVGPPFLVGVVTLAAGTSLVGYAAVHAVWELVERLRRSSR